MGITTQTDVEDSATWVLNRVGFGARTEDLEHAWDVGLARFVDELFEPDANGIIDDGDPWAGVELPFLAESPRDALPAMVAWVDRMVDASRPVSEWVAWFWHGHLTSSLGVVRSPLAMVNQLRMYRELGLGDVRSLLRSTSIDAAMLRYLDGDKSTGKNPNENYSRELLELFALGIGSYTEQDVAAGAMALTGWGRRRGQLEVQFYPRRHHSTGQSYLGKDGVHDLDTVMDAVVSHESCAPFLLESVASVVLGQAVASDVGQVETSSFVETGLRIGPMIRRIVDLGLSGRSEPVVLAPLPWTVAALRRTGASLTSRELVKLLRSSGQTPMLPPNVSGWPVGEAWLGTSGTAARLTAAGVIAGNADPEGEAVAAADAADLVRLARALGRPRGFTSSTIAALEQSGTSGVTLLNLALATPELVIT